jgi:zinc D-Ala-D-Ala carboxypeptidase
VRLKVYNEFDLAEMTKTSHTELNNTPNDGEIIKLQWLWDNFVLPMDKALDGIEVTSAFRSEQVNKAVGGVATSQHRLAEAVDSVPKKVTLEEAFEWCKKNMKFGQLIIEVEEDKTWIHISRERTDGHKNQQAMRMVVEDGKHVYLPA